MDIYLLIEGEQQGPYTEEQVKQSLSQGLIPGDLPAWREGQAEWVSVETVLDLTTQHATITNEAPVIRQGDISFPEQNTGTSAANTVTIPNTTARYDKHKISTWIAVAGGIVVVLVLAALLWIKTILPRWSLVISSQQQEIPDNSGSQNDENQDISPEDAQKWLSQKIEAFGGGVCTWYTDGLTIATSYHGVYFDGDVLCIRVELDYSNGNSRSYTEKINLAAIQPGSFRSSRTDTSFMSAFNNKPSVFYVIDFERSGSEPAKYSDNPDYQKFQFEIKDEQVANRMVKALNFLCKNAKTEPF